MQSLKHQRTSPSWDSSSYPGSVAHTPSDSVDVAFTNGNKIARAMYVGTSGDITLVNGEGNTVLFSNVPVGILDVGFTRVNATGTTASDIVALW